MAWTSPKTWTSEPLTSVDLNTYVRDNQNHLFDRIDSSASLIDSGASNYSTTATDWVDVDPRAFALTLQTHGGDVLLGFIGAIRHSADAKVSYFNVAVDGNNYFSDHGVTQFINGGHNDRQRFKPLSIVVMIPSLSPGSHIFKLRWKTSSSNSATLDGATTHPQFWAQEI